MSEESPVLDDTGLMNQLAAVARRLAFETGDSSVAEAEVYGPASLPEIEQALNPGYSGNASAPAGFYLVLLRGDFVSPRAIGPRSELKHYTTAARTWSPISAYVPGALTLTNEVPEVSRLAGPTTLSLSYRHETEGARDAGTRNQLLDHAAHMSPLWDCRGRLLVHPPEGEMAMLHRERAPGDLRPELEQLLTAGLVQLYKKTDDEGGFHSLGPEESADVIADERNWYAPYDLGEADRRGTVHVLGITDAGSASRTPAGEAAGIETGNRDPAPAGAAPAHLRVKFGNS